MKNEKELNSYKGKTNAGYLIIKSVVFENDTGFIVGENLEAPNPYVTWKFNTDSKNPEKIDCYWGHYFNERQKAIDDFTNRIEEYQRQFGVDIKYTVPIVTRKELER